MIISNVSKVVCAFIFREKPDEVFDVPPGDFHITFFGHGHPVLNLGKSLFDEKGPVNRAAKITAVSR